MATYRKDKGINVKSYTADPPNSSPSAFEGKLYYHSGDGLFKYQTLGLGAWASGGNINTGRNDSSGAGTSSAGLMIGGNSPDNSIVESYDGTSWTEIADLNTGRRALTSTGVQTAALAMGGGEANGYLDVVEKWNGTSWTEVNEVNTGRGHKPGSCGITTAGLFFGGGKAPGATHAGETESYDGTSWTETGDLNDVGFMTCGGGTSTSAVCAGGTNRPAEAETFNGTSWTEVSDINTGRNTIMGTGFSNSDSLVFGGSSPGQVTEYWDGSSWTELADLAAVHSGSGSSASTGAGVSSAFVAGGDGATAVVATTEEWAVTHTLKKVTTA